MNTQEEGTSSNKMTAAVSGLLTASKLFVLVAILTAGAAMGADLLRPKQTYFVDRDKC